MSTGAPPVIPDEFKQYNSYEEDPKWQTKFTIIWCSVLGFSVLLYILSRRSSWSKIEGLWGVQEEWLPEDEDERSIVQPTRKISGLGWDKWTSVFLWSAPGIGLNVGQILVIAVYTIVVLICIIVEAPLSTNSNRAGFIALAQLPPVFLFSSKTIPLLIGVGYEKLNYLHRWSARALFLGAIIHGSMWIQNHLKWGNAIIGEEKETYGLAAFGVLCIIVLTSLRVVRRRAYEFFFTLHLLAFPSFFILICYHTPYAIPWIFPPLAFYGFDLMMRMVRYRIKDASVEAVDNNMTLIHIPHLTSGWAPGQHVRLRVFGLPGRALESHPLTILSAPRSTTCLSEGGIVLGARVKGDWTKALNDFASSSSSASISFSMTDEKNPEKKVPTYVLIDGPYGSSTVTDHLASYEDVVMIAGGSGATFSIGILDDLVGRCVKKARRNGVKTKRIEWIWCVRGYGQVHWFGRYLQQIAAVAASSKSTLDLHIMIYVTCLCDPESLPHIDNCDVEVGGRPDLGAVLRRMLVGTGDEEEAGRKERRRTLGVCASGPESMTRDASNAVARVNMGRKAGEGVGLHTEAFAI